MTVGTVVFIAALLPSVFSDDKPAPLTSLTTGLVLIVFTVTYASLDLWVTTGLTAITATLWLTMFVQKMLTRKKNR